MKDNKEQFSDIKAQSFFRLAGVMFIVLDKTGKVCRINKNASKILKYPEKEILGKNWFNHFVPSQYRAEVKKVYEQLMKGDIEPVEYYENPVLTKKGEEKIIKWHNKVLRDEKRKIIGTLSSGEDITEKRKAEQALRESEKRYHDLFTGAPEGIIIADINTRDFLYANPAACKMFGYSEDEFKKMNVKNIHPKDALSRIINEFKAQARGKRITAYELPCKKKDGTIFYADISTTKMKIDDRECNVGFFTDVSERKQAEDKINYLTNVLKAVRNVNQLITKEKNRDKLIHKACELLTETRGYESSWIILLDDKNHPIASAESGLGEKFTEFTAQMKSDKICECCRNALKQTEVVIIDSTKSDCKKCPILECTKKKRAMTVRMEYKSKVYGLLSVILPVHFAIDQEGQELFSEVASDIAFALYSIEVEETLRKTEEKFRLISENSKDVICLHQPDGRYIYVSPSCKYILGYNSTELIGTNPWELVHPEDIKDLRIKSKRVHKGESIYLTYRIRKKSGEHIWFESINKIISDDSGNTIYFVSSSRDITERKWREQLTKAQGDLALAVSKTSSVKEILRLSVETVLSISDMDAGSVYFIDKDSGALNLMYHQGLSREFVDKASFYPAESPRTKLVKKGKAIHLQYSELNVPMSKAELEEGIKAFSLIPIWHKDKVIGSLHVSSRELEKISEFSSQALEVIAGQIGTFIIRAQVESKLHESERLFRNVFGSIKEGILVVNKDYRYSQWNASMEEISDTGREEVIGKIPWKKFSFLEGNIKKAIKNAMKGDSVVNQELRYKLKNGKEGWTSESYFPLRNSEGRIEGVVGVIEEITQRKEAVEAIRKSEEKYRTFFKTSRDCVFITSKEGYWIDFNEAAVELFGYKSKEELSKVKIPDLYVTAEDRRRHISLIEKKGYVKENPVDLKKKDGSIIHTLITTVSVKNDKGKVVAYQGTIRDITERKKALKALRKSEEKFRGSIMEAPFPAMVHAEDGEVILVNKIWEDISGYKSKEIPTISEWTKKAYGERKDKLKEDIDKLYSLNKSIDEGEYTIKTKQGRKVVWHFNSSPLGTDEKERRLVLSMAHDVTLQKKIEEKQKQTLQELNFINDTIMKISRMQNVDTICDYIGKVIKKYNPDAYVVVSLFDPEIDAVRVRSMIGFENTIKPILDILGKDPKKLAFHPEQMGDFAHLYTTGKLEYISGGIYDLMEGLIPKVACRTAEKFLGIENTFTVGFALENKPYGGIIILTAEGQNINYSSAIETITSHVSEILQRRQTELALKESEERYNALYDRSLDLVFIHDFQGNFLDANTATLDLFGYSKEEIKNLDFITLLASEDQMTKARKILKELIKTGYQKEITQFKLETKKGDIIWVETKSSVIYKKNKPYAVQGIGREITKRIQTEKALKSSEIWFREIFEGSRDAIFITDKQGRFIDVNKAAGKLTGYNKTELLNMSIPDIHEPMDLEAYGKYFNRIMNGEEVTSEAKILCKNGKKVDTEFSNHRIFISNKPYMHSVARDITERKKYEEAVRQSEKRFRLAAKAASDVIYEWDIKTDSLEWYGGLEKALGFKEGEIPYTLKGWLNLIHSKEQKNIQAEVEEHRKSIEPAQVEYRIRKKDGSWRYWVDMGVPLLNNRGEPIKRIGACVDITDQQVAKQQIKNDLKEKEVLLKEVHHRVKNNLNVIVSLLNLQSRQIENKDQALSAFHETRDRVYSMALVHDQLYQTENFSRINMKMYIKTMAKGLISGLSGGKTITLNMKLKDIYLDINKAIPCGLILNEIITNSLKHAFPKKKKGKIMIEFLRKNSQYEFLVRDNGVGLPEKFNVKKSTSLGLKLIHLLTEQIGGKLEIKRKSGTQYKVVFSDKDQSYE